MSIYDLTAYEVLQQEDLSDLKSKGTLLKHKKSGARVLLMENDDENKVFYIGLVSVRLRPTAREFRILWNIQFCADRENFR